MTAVRTPARAGQGGKTNSGSKLPIPIRQSMATCDADQLIGRSEQDMPEIVAELRAIRRNRKLGGWL